jgi:hypothetical protein
MSGHAASLIQLAVVSQCSARWMRVCLPLYASKPISRDVVSVVQRQTPTQGSYKDLAEQHKSFMQFTSPSTIG